MDETDPYVLRKETERLMIEKERLAKELMRTQEQLKAQVTLDKDSTTSARLQIQQIKAQIQHDAKSIQELNQLIQKRNGDLFKVTKAAGSQALTAAGLAQLEQEAGKQGFRPDADLLSDFSVISNETDIGHEENVLDLILNGATLDQNRLAEVLGNREIHPEAFQTFATVDFFNHETKHTDLTGGLEPQYKTQFRFKNNVDNFYLLQLETATVQVDIFLSRAQNALKIGSAKLPLSQLLEKDYSFQAQEVMHEGTGRTFGIGRVLYKMRMRKPLDEAIKWFQQSKAL